MIYTLTLNPSLDYLVEMEKLMRGRSTAQTARKFFMAERV